MARLTRHWFLISLAAVFLLGSALVLFLDPLLALLYPHGWCNTCSLAEGGTQMCTLMSCGPIGYDLAIIMFVPVLGVLLLTRSLQWAWRQYH